MKIMVAPDNPFLRIVPDKNEKIIDREKVSKELVEKTLKALKGGTLILLSADYGMGKSIITNHFIKSLKKDIKIIEMGFSNFIADDIRNLPSETKNEILVIIDRFDLIDGMRNDDKNKVVNLILERGNKGLTFIVLCTPDVLNKIFGINPEFKKKGDIISIPSMTYEEAKELVISRLNETRRQKSQSLDPFTETEIKEIWKKSKGNPRMILLLCATLYDRKMVGAL
jgi:hypothetical protein